MQQVMEKVGEAMRGELREVDHQSLKSDPARPRWNNTARWARNTMAQDGLLKKDSPRGVWEVTAAGRAHLERAGK
jgi:hypothetical protein